MAGISESLELDVSAARSAIENLGAQLEASISEALGALDNIRPTVDSSEITSGVEGGVEEADATVDPVAETDTLTSEISGGVEEADSTVVPEAETDTLTGEISGAVEDVDATVIPEPEVEQLTLGITGAVDDADATVIVDPDTGQLQFAITEAVQAADATVTVEADASGIQSASAAVEKLSGNVDKTSDATEVFSQEVSQAGTNALSVYSTAGLAAERTAKATEDLGSKTIATGKAIQVAIGVLATSAVVKFTAGLVSAASDNVEAQNKVNEVFKESAAEINAFAETSAESVGLAESSTQEFAATFGNLFTALGLGTEQAAGLSEELLTLGADLASFNNIPVEDALNRLRSGLVGQIRPLRALGVSFGAAAVEAKALELGLVDQNGEVTEAGKVQARFALIMEQTTNAQGDFARTSGDLANAQKILKAEFENARGEIGEGMLPAVLNVVQTLRGSAIPAFDSLGKALAPIGAAIIDNAAPAIQAFGEFVSTATSRVGPFIDAVTDLIGAFGASGGAVLDAFLDTIAALVPAINALVPIIETVSNIIGSIPEPVLRAIGTFLALRRAFLIVQAAMAAVSANAAAMSVQLAASLGAIGLVIAGIVGLASAFGFFGGSSDPGPDIEAVGDSIFGIAPKAEVAETSINSLGEEVTGLDAALADFITTSDEIDFAGAFENEDALAILNAAGLSVGDLTDLMQQGEAGAEAYEEALSGVSDVDLEKASATFGEAIFDQLAGFDDAIEAAELAAETRLELFEATEQLTAAEIEQIRVETAHADGTENVIAAGQRASEVAGERAAAEDAAATAIENTATEAAGQAESYEFLARAVAAGALGEDELAIASENLGISLENLAPFIDAVTKEVDGFVDAAVGTLPDVTDAINDLGFGITVDGINEALFKQLAAVRNFKENVLKIYAEFGPEVATFAAESGPLVAAAIEQGEPAAVEATRDLIGGLEGEYDGLDEVLREVGGRAVAETGRAAEIATEVFGDKFDIQTEAEREWDAAVEASLLTNFGPVVAGQGALGSILFGGAFSLVPDVNAETSAAGAAIGASPAIPFASGTLGATGSQFFAGALDFGGPAASETSAAAGAVEGQGPAVASAAEGVGAGATSGFGEGTEAIPDDAAAVFASGASAITGAQGALTSVATAVGTAIGRAFVGAVATGISSGGGSVRGAAIGAVSSATGASSIARTAGLAIGATLGAGIAAGIAGSVSSISREAAAAVNEAEAAARRAADAESPSKLFAELGRDLGAGIASGLDESDAAVIDAAEAVIINAAAKTRNEVGPDTVAAAASDAAVRAIGAGTDSGTNVQIVVVPFDRLNEVLPDGVRLDERAFLEGRI